jgi:hypothetical protein
VRVAYRPVDRAILGCYSVTPKDTLATFGCARHTGNGSYCVALDDLLAHADEAPEHSVVQSVTGVTGPPVDSARGPDSWGNGSTRHTRHHQDFCDGSASDEGADEDFAGCVDAAAGPDHEPTTAATGEPWLDVLDDKVGEP